MEETRTVWLHTLHLRRLEGHIRMVERWPEGRLLREPAHARDVRMYAIWLLEGRTMLACLVDRLQETFAGVT